MSSVTKNRWVIAPLMAIAIAVGMGVTSFADDWQQTNQGTVDSGTAWVKLWIQGNRAVAETTGKYWDGSNAGMTCGADAHVENAPWWDGGNYESGSCASSGSGPEAIHHREDDPYCSVVYGWAEFYRYENGQGRGSPVGGGDVTINTGLCI